ncbi:MAG: nucleotide-binding protein [Promethearchaeota archaeon]
MTKVISITGGKGGTGKTLISTNLATKLFLEGKNVLLVDCDVENPNTNILLGIDLKNTEVIEETIDIFLPEFDPNICNQCGICRESCYKHAIIQFPGDYPTVMEHMCSGCRTCQRLCPTNAIKEGKHSIGKSYFIKDVYADKHNNINKNDKNSKWNIFDLLIGELKEGEAISVLIVEYLLNKVEYYNKIRIKQENLKNKTIINEMKSNNSKQSNIYDYIILDTPPGAHCDVEAALSNSDIILAVTEPTPFGAHDLKRILDLIKILGKNAYIIVNRSNLTNYKEKILEISKKYNSPIIGEIPISNQIIEDYARGIPFIIDSRNFIAKNKFMEVYNKII